MYRNVQNNPSTQGPTHPRFPVSSFRFLQNRFSPLSYKYTLTLSQLSIQQNSLTIPLKSQLHTHIHTQIHTAATLWHIWTEYGQRRQSPSWTATPTTAVRRWSPVSGQSSTVAVDSRHLLPPAPNTPMSGRFRASPAAITPEQLWIVTAMTSESKLMNL